jgi:hypothetical protein
MNWLTYCTCKGLVDQLGIGRVADNVVDIIYADLLLTKLSRESLHVAVVASIESSDIARVGEFAINDGIFRVHIGLVKVISVFHMGASEA